MSADDELERMVHEAVVPVFRYFSSIYLETENLGLSQVKILPE
jgi:hypothetical protein